MSITLRLSQVLLSGFAAWALAAYAGTDESAAGSASDAEGLPEVVVTAQKRSQRLIDVPLSVTAASGDQLTKLGISSPSDLTKVVPGLFFQQSTFGVPVYSIRGIGFYSTYIGAEPTVTMYLDQVPLPYSIMASGAAIDLERVEVLKGPQGTLFGQNSTGGGVNYIAAKPTRDLQSGFDTTYGRFNEVDVDGYVSGPLTDTLSARVFVRKETRDGWQLSQSRYNAPSPVSDFLTTHADDTHGKRDFQTGRALLDWTPDDRVNFELGINGWRDRSDTIAQQYEGWYPQVAVGGYPEAQGIRNLPLAPHNDRVADWDPGDDFTNHFNFYQVSLRGNINLTDSLTLTSISAYSHFDGVSRTEADGTAFQDFIVIEEGNIDVVTQELRLAGKLGPKIHFTLGANYQHDKDDGDEGSNFTATNSGLGPYRFHVLDQPLGQRVDTKALFASGEYQLTDQLSAQGGLRYTDQQRDLVRACFRDPGDGNLATAFDNFLRPLLGGNPSFPQAKAGDCVTMGDRPQDGPGLPFVQNVTGSLHEHNVAWRAGLNWKPNRDSLIYANVTKGYKAGTFPSVTAILASQYQPIKQESVLAYELGFKLAPTSRVQVSGAVFDYKYDDKQLQGIRFVPFFGNLPALVSVPKSDVRGAELELTARPLERLNLSAGVTYIDSKVDRAPVDAITGLPTIVDRILGPFDITGKPFPNTPKWNGVSDAEYGFPISSRFSGFIGATGTYRSSTLSVFSLSPQFKMPGYGLLDLRTGLETSDGKLRLQVWGHNVTDKYYWTQATATGDTFTRVPGMPVTYGVTLTGRF